MDIILATGGTGGHIFPAMTLARTLRAQGYNCILFTDKKTNTNMKSYILPLCKLSGNKFKFFFLLMYSCVLAIYKIKKLKPRLVIGFGSYASFPTLLAARVLSVPIILHEQNTILGRVNRFFFKSAKLVATSFPETKYAEGNKCVFIGNFVDVKAHIPLFPITQTGIQKKSVWSHAQLYKRCDIEVISIKEGVIPVPRHWDPGNLIANEYTRWLYNRNWIPASRAGMTSDEEILNILIIAGSQGADFFDDIVSRVICSLPIEIKQKVRVMQQCTRKNINKVKDLYKSEEVSCELSEFFDDMESRLASAHLVVSRAGATSIAEITLAERPAIYIPYPHSKDNHQFYNAKYIEDLEAAIIIEQNSEAQKNLTELLVDLLSNSQKLHYMANNTKKTEIKNGITEFIKIIVHKFSR